MGALKKQIRREFRCSTMARDRYTCLCCGKKGKDRQGGEEHKRYHTQEVNLVELDAHHITPREEMANGGYVKENGITLCTECHKRAERDDSQRTRRKLYELIASSFEYALTAAKRLGYRLGSNPPKVKKPEFIGGKKPRDERDRDYQRRLRRY